MSDKSKDKVSHTLLEGRVVVPVTRPGKTQDSGIGKDGAKHQERGHSTIPITVLPPPADKKKS